MCDYHRRGQPLPYPLPLAADGARLRFRHGILGAGRVATKTHRCPSGAAPEGGGSQQTGGTEGAVRVEPLAGREGPALPSALGRWAPGNAVDPELPPLSTRDGCDATRRVKLVHIVGRLAEEGAPDGARAVRVAIGAGHGGRRTEGNGLENGRRERRRPEKSEVRLRLEPDGILW